MFLDHIEDGCIIGQTIEGEDASFLVLDPLSAEECTCRAVDFSSSQLTGASISGCTFTSCDFSSCDLTGTHMVGVRFEECTFRGTILVETSLKNVTFHSCYMQYSSLGSSRMDTVSFDECSLVESDLSSLRHRRLEIVHSRLERASFTGTALRDVDLSGSDITSVFLSQDLCEMRGARLDVSQVMQLASSLGIRIV